MIFHGIISDFFSENSEIWSMINTEFFLKNIHHFFAYSEKFQYLWSEVFFSELLQLHFFLNFALGMLQNFLKGSENLAYCLRVGDPSKFPKRFSANIQKNFGSKKKNSILKFFSEI